MNTDPEQQTNEPARQVEPQEQLLTNSGVAKKTYVSPQLNRHGKFEDKTLQVGSGGGGHILLLIGQ